MVDTSPNSWKLLYEEGRQALQARKLQDAEQSFSAALQLAEDFAAGDPRLVATLNALARIYSLQRRYLAAAALLNRLLEVTERTLGSNHVQVAGVLTNLAEMYTHLGAAREELELRERALAIRADDPNADATSLQRLQERVTELRAILASQEPAELDDSEMEPLPIVRTAEYTSPMPAPREPAPVASEPAIEPVAIQRVESIAPAARVEPAERVERDDAFRLSPVTAQVSVAPWPGAAATGTTPTSGGRTLEVEQPFIDEDIRPRLSASGVQMISLSESPVVPCRGRGADHGFSDMGRDELMASTPRWLGGRSTLYSIAAGLVLVAGILAARTYVGGSDDERESSGSVNLATANAPVVVRPVSTPSVPTDPRMVERLVAEQQERSTKQSSDESSDESPEPVVTVRQPRLPSAAEMERALRGVDNAVKAIDQKTRAVTDSATAIRLQAPTFKKVKIADP
jgi:hypothetical protein